jgi:hypothetical protein
MTEIDIPPIPMDDLGFNKAYKAYKADKHHQT